MKKTDLLVLLSGLFEYKIVQDEVQNEYVLFQSSPLNTVDKIEDRTAFEAIENHVHLVENVKIWELDKLTKIAYNLGNALLNNLNSNFPIKHFMVFVSIKLHDSMIIRFHQKWENEDPYLNANDFISSDEKVISFE